MKLVTLFSTSLLLGASGAMAQVYNSFINCVTPAGTPNGNVYTGAPAVSSGACITECLTRQFRYAYYNPSSTFIGSPARAVCSCSNIQPPATAFTRTTALGDISCFTPSDFQAFLLRTTNRFDGCSVGGGDRGPIKYTQPATFEQCLVDCVNFDTIYLQAFSNYVRCFCETGATPAATRCGRGDAGNYYTMYRRTPGAVASGGLRRRANAAYCATVQPGTICDTSVYPIYPQSPSVRDVSQDLCPLGLTACNVPGQAGSYECLDTQSELESCGGCLAGEFGNANSTQGADCLSKFPGAEMGSVTCSNGACLLY